MPQYSQTRRIGGVTVYETKVVLKAMARIVKLRAKSGEDEETCRNIYGDISDMANSEGVILKSYEDAKTEKDGE
jgi:hypothetical protein